MVEFFNTFLLNGEWKRCQRKVARANVQGSQPLVALSYPGVSTLNFRVQTIAELGACYQTGSVDVRKLKDRQLMTAIWIGAIHFELQTRVLLVRDGWASVEFIEPPELFRAAVRDQFQLELKAASLVPYISFTSVEPGPSHSLIYSDGEDHELILSMSQDRLDAIQGRLGRLAIQFKWSRRRPRRIEYEALDDRADLSADLRARVESFLRNLQDIHPQAVEAIQRAA